MDEDEETLYVSDTNSVKVFSIDGTYKDTTIGQLSTPKKKDDRQMRIIGTAYSGRRIEEILNPAGLVVLKQKLYVADRRGRILCFQV